MRYYEYGYSKIHPLTPKDNQDWDYILQLHKTPAGKHFDIRLRRPGESIAHSWAIKKLPTSAAPAIKAFRTKDHPGIYAYTPEFTSTKGIRVLQRGKARVHSIDKSGITFEYNSTMYKLSPVRGKQYTLKLL